MNENKKLLSIANFYTATFLYAKGIFLLNIDKKNPRRCKFVFQNSLKARMLLDAFNFAKNDDPKTTIDARKIIVAIKSLKEKLYQDNY